MANKMFDDLDFLEIPTNMSALDPITYQYFNQLLNYRTIIMNAGVDDNLLESVIIPLRNFENDNNNEPVTLILQSVGGSVIDGMVLMNIIDGYKKPLNIIVYGYAYSMGFAILCSGSKNPNVIKKCYPFTTALWHPGQVALSGSTNDVNDIQEFNKKVDLILKNYILENTFISKELYEKNERSQFYLTAQELFHYGIIDEIIDEVKIPSICKKCLLRRECENCIDYAYENITEDFSCEDFEPDV